MKKSYASMLIVNMFAVFFGSGFFARAYQYADEKLDSKCSAVYKSIFDTDENVTGNKLGYKTSFTTAGYDSMTTDVQKECYTKIVSGVGVIDERINNTNCYAIRPITISGNKLSGSDIKRIVYAVIHDHPEFFWIFKDFRYIHIGSDTVIKLFSTLSKNKCDDAIKLLDNKVKQILESVPQNLSEYDRELFIHDYLIKNCKYASTSKRLEWFTCYGCLVNGEAVCEGISRAAQILLSRLGIECRTVLGTRTKESHMWNIVKIGDEWYHLDVTWDIHKNEIYQHFYFNVTDAIIKSDHTINFEAPETSNLHSMNSTYNFPLPKCTSLKENYLEKNSLSFTSSINACEMLTYIRNRISEGHDAFFFKVDDNFIIDDALQLLLKSPHFKFFSCLHQINCALPENVHYMTEAVNYCVNTARKIIGIQVLRVAGSVN